jgi:hypothetical protein
VNTNRDIPARTNPFSTRFTRPGAIAYLFAPGQSPTDLVRKLSESAWRGQIIGPHGSGKSTLIAALVEPLERAGRRAHRFALHDGRRSLPRDWLRQARADAARLIIVDGYQQLSFWGRLGLKRICRRHGWGLLVTAHRDVGFPMLFRTSPSLDVAQAVVAQLLSAGEFNVNAEEVARSFAQCQGNLRETLFALYDRYEEVNAEHTNPASLASKESGADGPAS